MLDLIMDYVSASIIVVIVYPWVRFFETQEMKYIMLGLMVVFIDLSTKMIKSLTKGCDDIFLRPKNAIRCDILCRDGPSGGAPGFPSGHMATATFFATTLYLWSPQQLRDLILSVIPVILIGVSRYYKECHNIFQICSGTIYGLTLAYLTNRFLNM